MTIRDLDPAADTPERETLNASVGVTSGATPPPLTGRRTRLRPVFPADYEYLYALSTSERTAHRWRYRGMTPNPEGFTQTLWGGVLAQFLIERRSTGERVGHVTSYDANERNGFCHIAMLTDPAVQGSGWILEAASLFVNYLFTNWNFRKLYGEVPEYNYDEFASGAGRWFRVEGRLGEHEFYGGRYWDLLLLALYRADWEAHGGPAIAHRLAASDG